MSDSCFVCTTPYQIIAATAIVLNENQSADLVIVPQFSGACKYYSRIEELGIYSRVILVDTTQIESYKNRRTKLFIGLGILSNYICLNRIVPKILGETQYKRIYISSHAHIGRLISIYYKRKGSEIIFYDDGEGSYDSFKIYEAHGTDAIIRRFLFGKETIKLSNKRQLYCPELYELTFGLNDDLYSIINWSERKEILEVINNICDYSMEKRIDERFVLLDTIPDETFETNDLGKYKNLFDTCIKTLGDGLIVKKHPRDYRNSIKNVSYYKYSDIPFETVCANSNIESKVLLSMCSSAALMPKILFGYEPIVVSFHKILRNKTADSIMEDKMFLYIKEMYKDKERIIIPKTIEEAYSVVNKLKTF